MLKSGKKQLALHEEVATTELSHQDEALVSSSSDSNFNSDKQAVRSNCRVYNTSSEDAPSSNDGISHSLIHFERKLTIENRLNEL